MLTRLSEALSSRPKRTLVAVALFVAVAGVVGGPVAGSLSSDGGSAPSGSDSEVAPAQLRAAAGQEPTAGIAVVVDSASAQRIESVRRRLAAVPGIATAAAPPAQSRSGRRALVTGTLAASADDAEVADDAVRAFAGQGDVTVGGEVVANEQLGATVSEDLGRAELLAFPILLLLSLLFFRGRATLMPLVVGVTTVLGTFLALTAINQVYGLNIFALNLVIGLGLGLAIDYTLFLVTRYREELAARGPGARAITATMTTAGRTVAFSAATIACALITLTLFPQGFLKSMGMAGATVAIVAAFASLLISPALFGLWGAKLARAGRGAAAATEGRWHRLAHAVMRRPGAVAAATALAMLALALPALNTH